MLHQKLRAEEAQDEQTYQSYMPSTTPVLIPTKADDLRNQFFKNTQSSNSKDHFLLKILKENHIDPQKLIQLLQIMSMFSENDTAQFIKALDLNVNIDEFHKLKESLEKLKDLHDMEDSATRGNTKSRLANKDEGDTYDDGSIYRLPILRSELVPKDKETLIVDIVKEKFAGANLVRQMEHEAHQIISKERVPPERKPESKQFITSDQRFFQKNYGNMSMGCLNAIDKAYGDRRVIDRRMSKLRVVEATREMKRAARQQVDFFRQDHAKESILGKKTDHAKLEMSKIKCDEEQERARRFVQERRAREAEFHRRRKRDIQLAVEFSKQHISVSKALERHEFLTSREEKLKRNAAFVGDLVEVKKRQNELIKSYLKKRNAIRQEAAATEKEHVERRLKEDRDIEAYEIKKRVEFLKYEQILKKKYHDDLFTLKSSYYLFVKPSTPIPGDEDKDA